MKYIIAGMIIILLYISYLYRYYILWFFNALKVTLQNKKGIKDIQKQGMKIRNLDNDSIEKYMDEAYKYLNRLEIDTNRKFVLNEDLERHLRYSRFSEKYVNELLQDILIFYGLNKDSIDLKVEYKSSKYFYKSVGAYINKENENHKKEIILYIQNDMTMNTVISILAHECTHHLLLSNNIELKNRIQNECLTDVTAVVAGFGKFMVEGYKISNRVIFDEINHRSINKNRVGYLSYKDIEYVLKVMKKNRIIIPVYFISKISFAFSTSFKVGGTTSSSSYVSPSSFHLYFPIL